MKISTLLENHQLLVERHIHNSRLILEESCNGLDVNQKKIVEGIYNEMVPLIEASLSPEQIKQVFGSVEQSVSAGGGNRTMLGKGIDVAKKADEVVNKVGKWLQNTTPVAAFDQKFEDLKNAINKKFPDSKILDAISEMGMWAERNPGKTAAIVGVLTAIAGLAAGPVGGAIAGQILRGSVELLKGEKLSTAIGKGVKTAAYGFIAGKTFELIGDAIGGGVDIIKDNIFPGARRLDMTQIFDEVGGEMGNRWANFEIKGLVGQPADIADAKELFQDATAAWQAGDYAQSDKVWQVLQGMIDDKFNNAEYIAQIAATADKRQMMQQAAQGAKELFKFLGAAAQGAVAAAGTGGKQQKQESYYIQTRPLSEGQVYLVFNRVLNEAGFMDKLKVGAGKAVDWAKTKGHNMTTQVTADKLNSAWQKAGSPTDSEELANFLQTQGIDSEIVNQVYAQLKLPPPGQGNQDGGAQGKKAATLYAEVKAELAKLDKKGKKRIMGFLQKQLGTA
jgi:hypothetical protein